MAFLLRICITLCTMSASLILHTAKYSPRSELVFNVENALENFDYIMFVPLHFQSEVIGYIGVMYDLNCFNFKIQNAL